MLYTISIYFFVSFHVVAISFSQFFLWSDSHKIFLASFDIFAFIYKVLQRFFVLFAVIHLYSSNIFLYSHQSRIKILLSFSYTNLGIFVVIILIHTKLYCDFLILLFYSLSCVSLSLVVYKHRSFWCKILYLIYFMLVFTCINKYMLSLFEKYALLDFYNILLIK